MSSESTAGDAGLAADVAAFAQRARPLFDLDGRVALVVGGASGLGLAIAAGLAVHGADVVVADLAIDRAQETAAALTAATGRRALALALDVRDTAAVEAAVDEAAAWGDGALDISIHLAGINDRRPVLDLEVEAYERIIDTNLVGLYSCCRAVGRHMVARGRGKIINVASIMGHIAARNQAAYASSKGGVVQLTRVLAHEWAQSGVQVNALSPAHIRTPLAIPVLDDPETGAWVRSRILRGAEGETWEIIGPALFLASDASSFVTGSSLVVDGGWLAG